jgi:hypothetical protein
MLTGGECVECKKNRLGFESNAADRSELPEIPPIVHDVLRSPGQPLDQAAPAYFESRFRHDFGHVRVHTDAKAAESTHAISALAYTLRRDVVFGAGGYRPETGEGRRLIAHKLAHVVQQSAGDLSQTVPDDTRVSTPSDALEQEADRFVATAAEPGSTAPMMARQPALSPSPPMVARATVFHPDVNHDHKPSGRWADVQANPNSGFWESLACARLSPAGVVGAAMWRQFGDTPIALAHLNWYLPTGGGADFVEDANIDSMLRTDTGVQSKLTSRIPTGRSSGTFPGHFKLEQSVYVNQDFRFTFGAIDRFDFEVDFASGTLHAWFQDRYEWHLVYPFYSQFPDDVARETNCVRAALVELKIGGVAQDYWMKGEAMVPLGVFGVLPHSRCIWPHRRRWAFRCYMRADDFAAKFLKVTEGGTYLHRECGRAVFGPATGGGGEKSL